MTARISLTHKRGASEDQRVLLRAMSVRHDEPGGPASLIAFVQAVDAVNSSDVRGPGRRMAAAHPISARYALALQRAAGNQAAVTALRSPDIGVEAGEVGPEWAALETEIRELSATLVALNERPGIVGTRSDWIRELHIIWSRIGPPDTPLTRLRAVRRTLDGFRRKLAEENELAHDSWKVIEEEYRLERGRLEASTELTDRKAIEYLDAAHAYSQKRILAAGNLARWEDVAGLAHEMAMGRYIDRAFEATVLDIVREGAEGELTAWPWPPFKAGQLTIEASHYGLHHAEHLKAEIRRSVDSAIRYQIRQGVNACRQLGMSQAEAAEWALSTYKKAGATADRLVAEMPVRSETAHRWSARLQVAGKLTIGVDIGASVIDVWASPPEERPKKIVIHSSRIAGGLAGARAGSKIGARLGSRLGPKGAFASALVGGFLGGLAGAWSAKKVAKFIANEIWPPEATYYVVVGPDRKPLGTVHQTQPAGMGPVQQAGP